MGQLEQSLDLLQLNPGKNSEELMIFVNVSICTELPHSLM